MEDADRKIGYTTTVGPLESRKCLILFRGVSCLLNNTACVDYRAIRKPGEPVHDVWKPAVPPRAFSRFEYRKSYVSGRAGRQGISPLAPYRALDQAVVVEAGNQGPYIGKVTPAQIGEHTSEHGIAHDH